MGSAMTLFGDSSSISMTASAGALSGTFRRDDVGGGAESDDRGAVFPAFDVASFGRGIGFGVGGVGSASGSCWDFMLSRRFGSPFGALS